MSLESVEMVIGWEDAFGVTLTDGEAAALRTPRDVTSLMATKLGAVHGGGPCPTQRIFHRLRGALVSAASVRRSAVTLQARLRDLLPRPGRRRRWQAVQRASGFSEWPGLGFGWGVDALLSSITVADVVRWLDDRSPKPARTPSAPWTREQVRSVVRAVTIEHTGLTGFSDDADFVNDLGID